MGMLCINQLKCGERNKKYVTPQFRHVFRSVVRKLFQFFSVYLKNQFAIVGRFSANKCLAIGVATQLRRKRPPASIDYLNLIVVENLDGNWQPQPGPKRLARNQKIIKGCVTVCEAAVKS